MAEDDELPLLLVQTMQMQEVMAKYPKVVLFDHTIRINENRMPTPIMNVMDGNAESGLGAFAFSVNDQASTMATV